MYSNVHDSETTKHLPSLTVFTNDDNLVENLQYLAPVGSSDHVGLLWTFKCTADTVKLSNRVR